jgi:hypothetical protein
MQKNVKTPAVNGPVQKKLKIPHYCSSFMGGIRDREVNVAFSGFSLVWYRP